MQIKFHFSWQQNVIFVVINRVWHFGFETFAKFFEGLRFGFLKIGHEKKVSVSVEILVPSVIIEQLIVHLRQTLQLKGSDDHHMMPGKMFEWPDCTVETVTKRRKAVSTREHFDIAWQRKIDRPEVQFEVIWDNSLLLLDNIGIGNAAKSIFCEGKMEELLIQEKFPFPWTLKLLPLLSCHVV